MIISLFTLSIIMSSLSLAQNQLAAVLEVLNAGVQVQRVNTANFIEVSVEAIIGVGDVIKTDETGEARITFFADGTDVTLEPNTEYRLVEFQGDDEDFQLTMEIIAGQTAHRLNRVLGANSNYAIDTPGMTLGAQGTVFAVRVEDSGRAGMLVFEGTVEASAEDVNADVPPEFGIRSAVGSPLSDVVRASTFAELDAALDGCAVSVTTQDDTSINVRVGPALEQTRIGTILPEEIDTFFGVNEDGAWYRIEFDDAFGWMLSSTAQIDANCAGLRVFANDFVEGDASTSETPAETEPTEEAPDNTDEESTGEDGA